MATRDEIYAALRNADKAGDGESVKRLAAYLETLPIEVAKPAETRYDPSEGGGELSIGPFGTGIRTSQGVDRVLSGMGAGMSHMARGVGQMIGLSDQGAVDEARRLEEPLQATGAGKTGDVLGRIATVVPTAFIPGANTLAGAAAIGAGTGAVTTEGGVGDRAIGAGLGGVAGPAGLLLGRALVAGGQGARAAFVDPFTRAGQDRIAARTLQNFAGGQQPAAAAVGQLRNAPPVLPGVQPTAGELTENAGIAQLERTLRQNPDLANAFTERLMANRGALIGAVDGIAGDEAQMAAAVAARQSTTEPLYHAATQANYVLDGQLRELLSRPIMQRALARAEQLAANQGRPFSLRPDVPDNGLYAAGGVAPRTIGQSEQVTGRGLQDLKMAVDSLLEDPTSGIVGAEARVVRDVRGQLLRWMEERNPAFREARTQYAGLSAPINQMQVGQALRDRLIPALADYGAPRTNAQSFAGALRDGDALAARATNMPNATIENTLTAEQQNVLQRVAEQLGRRARADELGRIPGSPTAQNLVSQNLLRQVLGPLGLPESLAENTLAQTLLRPAQFVGRLGEGRITDRLAQALLDPQDAANLLMLAPPQREALTNALAQAGRVGGNSLAAPN